MKARRRAIAVDRKKRGILTITATRPQPGNTWPFLLSALPGVEGLVRNVQRRRATVTKKVRKRG